MPRCMLTLNVSCTALARKASAFWHFTSRRAEASYTPIHCCQMQPRRTNQYEKRGWLLYDIMIRCYTMCTMCQWFSRFHEAMNSRFFDSFLFLVIFLFLYLFLFPFPFQNLFHYRTFQNLFITVIIQRSYSDHYSVAILITSLVTTSTHNSSLIAASPITHESLIITTGTKCIF